MSIAVGLVNLVLGTAYTGYGIMTAIELKRDWRLRGFSHFSAAWIAMAFTCGPHHLFHGVHTLFEGRAAGALDLYAVAVGLPVGVIWLLLRIEAFVGGRGDRFIRQTPRWLAAMPTVAAVYLTILIAAALRVRVTGLYMTSTLAAHGLLFVIYMTIGYILLRTQLRNRPAVGGWSVSGLALTTVFPTCAMMHAVWVLYASTGRWAFDIHALGIAWLGVPAGLYFLWVVVRLYHNSLSDWNRVPSIPASRLTSSDVHAQVLTSGR